MTPAESLKAMQLSDDFHVELFLSEPQVVDPVEMAFDENGRIYVAEMRDYPDDPPPGKPARSRIRLLEDKDGDGKYETATIFADQVLEVSGLMPWKGGLIVTSAPDILYMKDTDGDGKADEKRVLYTGFPKVNPEGRITNLRLGIDNWIYAANEGREGSITSPEHPERPPISTRGTDFRFHMIKGLAESASGPTQFGMALDDFGNRFLTQNTTHVRNAVLPMQYLARAPYLTVGPVATDISDHGKPSAKIYPLTHPQSWRQQRTKLRQQRYDENQLNRKEEVGGWFTAASGGTIYNGDAFPKEYYGNLFTGDVSANLIHRDILTPDGVTFSAHRAKDNTEFLRSTDVWFRPCNFANAPDGLLYFTDIYREFIETPESIPEELKKRMDFYSGDTLGRIYRFVPNHPLRKGDLKPNLSSATSAELVRQLANPNGWHRTTAKRLLLERQDKSVAPDLVKMAQDDAFPQARLHALWMLEGLGVLDPAVVIRALEDADPRIREHALRLAETFLAQSQAVAAAVLKRLADSDTRVQFQLAFTLGQLHDARSLEAHSMDALAQIAHAHSSDHWFQIAILSSVANSASPFFHMLMAKGDGWVDQGILTRLANQIGARRDPNEVGRLLAALPKTANPEPLLAALASGLRLSGVKSLKVPGAEASLGKFLASPSEPLQSAAWDTARYLELTALVKNAEKEAVDPNLAAPRKALAVRALRGGRYNEVAPVLQKVLDSHPSQEIQTAAVDALASFDETAAGPAILSNWRSYSPEARTKAVAAMLTHKDRVPLLLASLEKQEIEPSALDLPARTRLVEYPDPAIAQRARAVLKTAGGDRAKVVEQYKDALRLAGDVNRGKHAFDEACAKCHMPRKQGGRVGPDLSGINNKTKEELLTSILNPSYAIEQRFVNYVVTTKDGRMYDGVIASETPAAITLRGGSELGDEVVLRKNIAEVRASAVSLMPEELEKTLSKQDLADIISYLRGGL